MLSKNDFIRQSLDLHLFFVRIVKEHAFFLSTSFTPKEDNLSKQASAFQKEFEKILFNVVCFSNNMVSPDILKSQEIVTPFTFQAESVTIYLTGEEFSTQITKLEEALEPGNNQIPCSPGLEQNISLINNNIINLVTSFITFQNDIISRVSSCYIFTTIYPLQLKHIVKEAQLYLDMIHLLQERKDIIPMQKSYARVAFWNDIMGEHAEFIRGLLDPSEKQLITGAEYFAKEFNRLTKEAKAIMDNGNASPTLTTNSLKATEGIKDFKQQATQGILECKIQSIIIPLLADHVLREANHYLRLLKK